MSQPTTSQPMKTECSRCAGEGHSGKNCKLPKFCSNCQTKGHSKAECRKPSANPGSSTAQPPPPPPDDRTTKTKEVLAAIQKHAKAMYSSNEGVPPDAKELNLFVDKHGLRTDFGAGADETQMFRTVSSDNTIPSIMVHSAADKKSLVPVIKSREVRLDSSDNWVSDGDLIWSTTDIWGDLAQGKRRGSRAMHLDHRPGTCDLSYDNECGESLTIEHVDINYLQTIHTQQQHIGELLHIPTGTAFRRSTPDLLLRGLNAMLTAQARTSRTVTSKGGNKLFDTTAVQSLGKQVRALSGFFLSARPGADSLLLNINTAFSPFWDKITVHDYIKARSSSSDSQLVGALKGLQVNIRYDVSGGWRTPSSSRRFIVDVGRPINHQTCQDPAFQNMTVQDWYSQQRPHPLCPAPNVRLQLDDGERAIKVAKNTQENPADTEYFPASVLDIVEFQPLHGEMSGTQTAKMIKVARLSPEENRGKILNEGLPLFSLDQGNQGHLSRFGHLSTGTGMLTVPGFYLDPPKILYRPPLQGKKGNQAQVQTAAWKLVDQDRNAFRFTTATVIRKLPYINLSWTNDAGAIQSLDEVRGTLALHGLLPPQSKMQWTSCAIESTSAGNRSIADFEHDKAYEDDVYNVLLQATVKAPDSTILIILKQKDPDHYAYLKRVAELQLGLKTVMVDGTKLAGLASDPQHRSNIALKYNLRAGNTNHRLDPNSFRALRPAYGRGNDTIVIGADVTHPGTSSREGTPSIAAVVGCTDDDYMHFPGSMRLQRSRKEEIAELGDMVKERLIDWAEKHKWKLPGRMLFYRDGVSESQYDKMRDYEIPQIQQAYNWAREYLVWRQSQQYAPSAVMDASSLRNPWPVAASATDTKSTDTKSTPGDDEFNDLTGNDEKFLLTYVVVGKRHNTRFYPTASRDEIGFKNGNVRPGLVVDQIVTHPYSFDFYLQSHSPIVGTGRSAHYFVIQNQMGLQPQQLQAVTHDFCYAYARATRGVSYCAPAFYADRLCDRARFYLRHWLQRRQGYKHTRTRNLATRETHAAFNTEVKNHLRDNPYWRPHASLPQPPKKYGFDRRNPWHANLDDTMFYL